MALPKVLANFETSLASKISKTATTGTLNTSTDPDNTALSGDYILTFDEGQSTEEHALATLSGASITAMTRGLSRVDGKTSKTSIPDNRFEHGRGSSVKITNMNLIKVTRLINGEDQFDADNIMEYDAEPSFTSASNEICTVKFAEDQANAGAADASTVQKGIAEEATDAEIDADTASGSVARLFVNPSTLATSKYGTRLPSADQKTLLDSITSTASEINTLDGYTGDVNDLNEMEAFFGATDITGAEAETLTDGSNASSLHGHIITTGQGTRTTGEGTGDETIAHGLGVTPRFIKITYSEDNASSNPSGTFGAGTATSTSNESCTYLVDNGSSSGGWTVGQESASIVHTKNNAGTTLWNATLSTLDSTNIVLAFNSAGGGTLFYQWEAYS